jgi:hypothetical protein
MHPVRAKIRPLGFAAAFVLVLAAAGFLVGRIVTGTPASGDEAPVDVISPGATIAAPPGPDVSPVPGETPDMTKPWWYVPYVNADAMAEKFTGEIGGLRFTAEARGPSCDRGAWYSGKDALARAAASGFTPNLDNLPSGVTVHEPGVSYFECEAGEIIGPYRLELDLIVQPGVEGADKLGSTVSVVRLAGWKEWPNVESADRWQAGEVAGRPAALLRPIIGLIGYAATFVNDSDGSTRVMGPTSLELNVRIAEGLYR